jgi:hypothetical protein
MSRYTTQIRTIIDSEYPLFDFSYPIFDENYRGVLEQKIIDRYYFREIGFETVGQFKHYLKTKLNEIMPYYNRLYETEHIITKDDYMINLDNKITRTNNVNTESNSQNTNQVNQSSESSSSDSSTGRSIYSDTPQGKIADLDYATNLTDTETSGSGTATGTGEATTTDNGTGTLTTIEQYTEQLIGNASMRYNADIMEEWKQTWRNIDVLILDELNDLFMNIY